MVIHKFIIAFGFLLSMNSSLERESAADIDDHLILPPGFRAETVIESLGNNRHIAVNENGDIYVKLEQLKDGKGIYVLRKVNAVFSVIKSFGDYGGTGILIKDGYLYATSNN